MKLLMCLDCSSIFNLTYEEKSCVCGKTKGKYIDNLNAEISGNCEPIGFANTSFMNALKIQRYINIVEGDSKDVCCKGEEFTAFIIPKWATSIKRIPNIDVTKD